MEQHSYNKVYRTVGALFLAWVIAFLDRQILTMMTPELRADLGLSDVQLSLLQGFAFSLVFGLAGLFGGRLIDRRNRRNLIAAGLAIWSLMTFLCGFAESFAQLFVARMGVGIGEAILAPATVSILSDMFDPKSRGRMMGIMLGGASIGTALSLITAGQILQAVGPGYVTVPLVGAVRAWELTFMSVGLLGVPVLAWIMMLPEPHRQTPADGTTGEDAKLSGFWNYLLQRNLLFPLILLSFGLKMMVSYGSSIWLPTAFRRIYGIDPGVVGLTVGIAGLATGLLGGIAGGWLSDKWAVRDPARGRLKLYQSLLLAQFFTFTFMLTVPGFWPNVIAYGLFLSILALNAPAGYTILSELVPPRFRGRITALMSLVTNLVALGLGPFLIAFVNERIFGDDLMIMTSIATVAIAASLIGLLSMQLVLRRAGVQRQSLLAM